MEIVVFRIPDVPTKFECYTCLYVGYISDFPKIGGEKQTDGYKYS